DSTLSTSDSRPRPYRSGNRPLAEHARRVGETQIMTPIGIEIGHLAWVQFWQVTLVALGVGLVSRLFCRRRPHMAYVLWMLVLLKSLTPPIWTSPTGIFSLAALALSPTTSLESTAGT